jgi:hypothetical protein
MLAAAASSVVKADDSEFNTSRAIVGRQLFPRSSWDVYCIEAVQTAGSEKQQRNHSRS